jgi:DNA-binding IclR family transcriptional regulator
MSPSGPPGRSERVLTTGGHANCHQTIERCMRILEYVWARQAPVRLTRISHALDMDRSTVLRILQTLENLGYIHRNPDSKAYALGYMSQRLGARNRLMHTNAHHADPFLRRLAAELGETVTLGAVEGVSVIFHRCIGAGSRPSPIEIGAAYDAHATASGKMLLANAPSDELRRLYRHHHLRRHTGQTVVCFEQLLRELQECWARGYALEQGELFEGYGSIAVPVVNPRGISNVAVGILAPLRMLTPARCAFVIERCSALAREVYRHVIR